MIIESIGDASFPNTVQIPEAAMQTVPHPTSKKAKHQTEPVQVLETCHITLQS